MKTKHFLLGLFLLFQFKTSGQEYKMEISDGLIDGLLIENIQGNGLDIRSCFQGMFISNVDDGIFIQAPLQNGIYVNEARGYAAHLKADIYSTKAGAVLIEHEDDAKHDLLLHGVGRLASDQSLEIQIDRGNTLPQANFKIKSSAGNTMLSLNEAGNLSVAGFLTKGGGSFKIDHPLDPKNKYLSHSFVESPDMMNIYNGNVILDSLGESVVDMPDWFEALNRDFRYQVTAIGMPNPDLYIAEEIRDGKFIIAGGEPQSKVSWMVTGIRQDAYANHNRMLVEQEKAPENKGTYMHPEAWKHKLNNLTNNSKTKSHGTYR